MAVTTLCGGWLAGVTSMERPVGMRLLAGGEVSKGQPVWDATWVVFAKVAEAGHPASGSARFGPGITAGVELCRAKV